MEERSYLFAWTANGVVSASERGWIRSPFRDCVTIILLVPGELKRQC
jgi:hypothetical protein